jgi:PKD repeat protein
VTGSEDKPLSITLASLLGNDRDPEGGPLTFVSTTAPSRGTLTEALDVAKVVTGFTYTPVANFNGTDTFTYTVRDAKGLTGVGTVTITVTPVNDAPFADNEAFSFVASTTPVLAVAAPGLLVGDTDADGNALTAQVVTGPARGALELFDGRGGFRYRPAAGFLGTDQFTYRVIDGQGGTSNVATVTLNVLAAGGVTPAVGSTGGVGAPAPVQGYTAGTRVYFDGNLDGEWNFVDANGNGLVDPGEGEPSAFTTVEGPGGLFVATALDDDGDGILFPHEGILVASGGVVTLTGRPLEVQLRAPLGSSVITPLTSVLTAIVLDYGLDIADAQASLLVVLGLPPVDLTQFDPIAETLAGNPDGPTLLGVHAKVAIASRQINELLSAAAGVRISEVSRTTFSGFADEVVTAASPLNLGDAATLGRILERAAGALGVPFAPQEGAVAAGVMAASLQAIDAIAATGLGYVEAIARVEAAAQGSVAADLWRFGAGRLGAEALVQRTTGAALAEQIASAQIGLLQPPDGEVPTLASVVATEALESGQVTLFGSVTGATAAQALALRIDWSDGITQQISLAPGEVSFRIDHGYDDDDPTGTFQDSLAIGVVLLVDSVATDATAVTATIVNTPPRIENLVFTPASIVGGAVSVSGDLVDRGPLDTFTLTIDWGDGTTIPQAIERGVGAIAGSHTYTATGRYVIIITVTDDDGGTSQEVLEVGVREAARPVLEHFGIDDGSAQRSMIRDFELTFDQPVTLDAGLITLGRADGLSWTPTPANPSGDGRVWTLGFFGPETTGGSLPDGSFTLTLAAGAAVNALGQPLSGDEAATFQRLFGDVNGDGVIGATDRAAFRAALGTRLFDPGFWSVLDANADDVIDALDTDALELSPVVDAGPDRAAREASSLTVVATLEDFGAGHMATIDWGDGTIDTALVVATAAGLGSVTGAHAYLDDGAYAVRVVVTDADGHHGEDELTVSVANVAPEATLAAPTLAIRGLVVALAGAFIDPGTLDTHQAAWDFGDGTRTEFRPAADALTPTHVFADSGTYIVTLTVRDDDGGTDTAKATIVVKAVALVTDPCDPDELALFVMGSGADDRIRIAAAELPRSGSSRDHHDKGCGDDRDHQVLGVEVWINGVSQGIVAHDGRIIVTGLSGNDDIEVSGSLRNEVVLFGGSGDDRLKAGGGPALLVGGEGKDWLIGGPARDILIGGVGGDCLEGGGGEDLLIAGRTVDDDDVRALCALAHEWLADARYDRRVARLTKGVTVLDDAAEDTLTGGSGADWFLAATGGQTRDKLTDRHGSETLTALKAIAPAPDSCRPVIDWNRCDDGRHHERDDDNHHERDGGRHHARDDDRDRGCDDRGRSRWARDFVLDLGGHHANRDLRILPGASAAKKFSRV